MRLCASSCESVAFSVDKMAGEEVIDAKGQILQNLPPEQGYDESKRAHHRQLVVMNIHSLGEKLRL